MFWSSAKQLMRGTAVRRRSRSASIVRVATIVAVFALLDVCGASAQAPTQSIGIVPAGAVPDRIGIVVTGAPASSAFVTARIAATLARAIAPTLSPGSRVATPVIIPSFERLERGYLTSFRVAVTIEPGPGAVAVSAVTTVDVVNADVDGFSPSQLAFRDDPERIVADGVLSRTVVDAQHPTRVYYYHQNMRVTRRFCVVLSANDSVRTRVAIVGAVAGPNVDVMSVGHAVTRTFLTRQAKNEGSIVEIAGGRPYLERDTMAGPGDGIVGSVDLRVLSGGPVTMTVLAIAPGTEPADYLYTTKLTDDGHGRHGVFDLATFGQSIMAFTAGGRDAAYVYGQRRVTPANLDATDTGRDYGDYGVLERVAFDLDNPSNLPVTLFLYEKPLGGVVRSSFLVNGVLTELGCVRVPQRYEITRYELAPRSTAVLDVRTMTDGGSNYPLEIGLTATPVLTTIPPITAPDGCFPKPRTQPSK